MEAIKKTTLRIVGSSSTCGTWGGFCSGMKIRGRAFVMLENQFLYSKVGFLTLDVVSGKIKGLMAYTIVYHRGCI